ncbi:MAG TPA: magnesium transporter [Smithella sp.]|jgi:magnesium transporter|nr:magnesium transporter [Smithella sp.]NMC96825.1 magnesium transporter [Deltaproteobacteria bacterium]OQC54110.1 MAG: Magnesium transporter MgtE [Deltaproteobacteria bacterium ADurb.Bin022]HNQ65241.1 magnesium transporter [Smithella sp.]HOE31771.1 magnesium transporter [Smithella sp.]
MQKVKKKEPTALETLKDLISRNREFDIIDLFSDMHPADIADLIDELEEEDRLHLFSLLDVDKASDVILELSDTSREQLIEDLSNEKLTDIIEEMDSDDKADIIAELSDDQAKAVLEAIEPEESQEVQELLKYADDTAGGIMQSELVSVRKDATINDAFQAVADAKDEIENIHNIFVVDETDKLIGTVPLQSIITTKRFTPILDIIDEDIPSVLHDMDQEEVARLFKKYDLVSIGVVDNQQRLLGRITIDDVVDAIQEETSEDIYRIAGLGEDDTVFNNTTESVKKRLPWLYLNLITALASVLVIGFFEETIKLMVALVFFMPVVAGLGGNAGSQTLTLIVRGMALGEITFENAKRALFRQIAVGIANGIAVGIVIGIIAYFWKGIPILGLILGLAMIISIFTGTLVGALIPLALKRLKLDPALGSHIFLTAFTDAFGFLTFLGLATIFLKIFHL